MKKLSLFDFFDQRGPVSHTAFLLFTLAFTLVLGALKGYRNSPWDLFSIFFMIFIQIEVFIYVGNILFSNLNFDRSPGEITRIVVFRFLIFIAACLLVSMILYIILKFIISLLTGGNLSGIIPGFFREEWHEWFRSTIKGLTFGAVIFITLLWQTSLRREQKLREENLIFQNETLKNQVNPHFLFNSLNTISSLIQSQPEAAESFVSHLSSIYRYILENGQKNKVPLKLELGFVNDYFNLHRIRDDEKIVLAVNVSNPEEFSLLPVSLQILLENAIKHNSATRENQLKISIYLEDTYIVVKNNLQRKATQLQSTGTGLRNLSERIRLITGRELIVEETEDYFTVKLPLMR